MSLIERPEIRTGEKFGRSGSPLGESANLDEWVWVDCEFQESEMTGAVLTYGVFTRCHFERSCLYWCNAFKATFVDCKFHKCDLRGTFTQARFVRCGFVHCQVGANNLGGTTEWENAEAVECVVAGAPLPIIQSDENYI